MSETIRISAKNLGSVALPDFCPRCFWASLKLGFKLPFQIFPGIFSSIDSYNKRIVHSWFDKYKKAPKWLQKIEGLIGYIEPPHHSKFNRLISDFNILLTGNPDGVFVKNDNSYVIVDYKTAKYTGTQDKLFPMYETQLNAYAYIAEEYGLKPVSNLALIYMEPITSEDCASSDEVHRTDGFSLNFAANIHYVDIKTEKLTPLFAKVRDLNELKSPPRGNSGCKDCNGLDEIIKRLSA
jgi:hypothetical protein